MRERSRQNASSCSSVMPLVCSLTFSAPRCFISTQSNVFAFITDHLQGRENTNMRIPSQRVDSIIQGNLLEVHDMLKVPAHDEQATGSCCNGHVERIVRPLRRDNPGIQIGSSQPKRLVRDACNLHTSKHPSKKLLHLDRCW